MLSRQWVVFCCDWLNYHDMQIRLDTRRVASRLHVKNDYFR